MAVTNQQIVEFLLANPGMSDADIVAAMEQYGVSPAQMAETVGIPEGEIAARVAETIPPGQTVTLGDTVVQPVYTTTGSGDSEQVGGLENVITYKASENKKDGAYTQYLPSGEVEKTGTQQEVKSGLKEFAIGTALLLGLPTILNAGAATGATAATVGTTGLSELALADLSLGGAGGTLGAETLASALTTGATVPTLTNLTGGSGLLTGEAAGITADSVAKKLAADAATQFELTNAGASALTPAGVPPVTPPGLLTPPAVPPVVPPTGIPPVGTPPPGGAPPPGGVPPVVPPTGAPPVVPPVGDLLKTGLTAAQIAALATSSSQTAAGLLQQKTSKEAADKARVMIDAETAAAKTGAQFRPVGMTTRFGSSQFAFDPKTGQLTSAGYTLSPEAKAAQDRFVKLAESGLTQAEGAQKAFEPLQTGAQSLFSLGNKYLAQTPEQVASDYLKSQMALLQPGRELELANLQNKLQQQGRGGLSVAMGGNLGATTPELQALYNARAQQEALLAANAQQAGQQNVLFGAGLLGTGASTMGQYYGGQQAAYSPYTTALGQVQALEGAGQQPLTMGIDLGKIGATTGFDVGRLGLQGAGQSVALATSPAATNSSLATGLTALGSSGLLSTGIDMAGKAIGNRLDSLNELGLSVVSPAQAAAPTGPMNVNTADIARRLGINLPASYTGTTTTVNPLAPTQQYNF